MCEVRRRHTITGVTPRRAGLRLATVFGIRISLGISWFLILFFYIIYTTPYFHEVIGGSSGTAYGVTVVTVLALFLSLIVHELGHALVARRNGLQVVGIELWALGGITRTTGSASGPGGQFRIAAAGPLATVGMIVLWAARRAPAPRTRASST